MAGIPFGVLLYNLGLRALAANLQLLPEWCQAVGCRWVPGLSATLLPDREALEPACKRMVIRILTTATRIVAPWVGAIVACFARHLRGLQTFISLSFDAYFLHNDSWSPKSVQFLYSHCIACKGYSYMSSFSEALTGNLQVTPWGQACG